MRYKIVLSYDGTHYCGWQVQSSVKPSIQSLVQQALETSLRHPVCLTGAGRTDAGVHARGQTAHFDSPTGCAPHRLLLSLNALLPPDIRVVRIETVPSNFHARYSALAKVYHYFLHLDPVESPFHRLYRYRVLPPFDRDRLQRALPFFVGQHDFSSFANRRGPMKEGDDPIRTLYRLDAVQEQEKLTLIFEGDGFLYKMVRNLTGTLLDIAAGKIELEEIEAIFAAKDRRRAGSQAPAHGLFLMEVKYPLEERGGEGLLQTLDPQNR